ncbi:TPA: hypothetical protein ACJJBX_001747 [Neisseria meningitidis]
MNETDLPKLLSVINRFTNIDKNWSCVLLFWIQRATGYLEMMTLDDDSEYWNSLEESFEEFCIRHTTQPNQLIADIPHAKKEKVTMWIKSLLKLS